MKINKTIQTGFLYLLVTLILLTTVSATTFECDFDVNNCGITGTGDNNGDGVLNSTTFETLTLPINLSNSTSMNITAIIQLQKGATFNKWYFHSNEAAASGFRWYFENTSTTYNANIETSYSGFISGITPDAKIEIKINTNTTENDTSLCWRDYPSGSFSCQSNIAYTPASNPEAIKIETTSGSTGFFALYNITVDYDGASIPPAPSGNNTLINDRVFPLNPNDNGFLTGAGTHKEDYNTIINEGLFQTLLPSNQSWSEVDCPYGKCILIPKYDSSSSFSSLSDSGNGATYTNMNMSRFLMVTDEFSQVMQQVAMANNETRMINFINTVKWINASSDGHGYLTEWIVAYLDGVMYTNVTSDTASDADARIIDALFTCSGNSDFTNETRNLCYDYGANMTGDFAAKNFLDVTETSSITGEVLQYAPCGGSNVCTDMVNNGFMYTGYYGDNAIALLKACARTGNITYCEMADDTMLFMMQAAEYNGVDFTAIEGLHHKWDAADPREPVCTENCGGIWDYADAVRLTSIGVYEKQLEEHFVFSGNLNLSTYIHDWVNQAKNGANFCITNTTYAVQYYPNGTCGTGFSGYFELSLGGQLVMQQHPNTTSYFVESALTHYNQVTKEWDSQDYGVYRQAFPIRLYGISMGLDEESYNTFSYLGINNSMNDTNSTNPPTNGSEIESEIAQQLEVFNTNTNNFMIFLIPLLLAVVAQYLKNEVLFIASGIWFISIGGTLVFTGVNGLLTGGFYFIIGLALIFHAFFFQKNK